MQNADCLRIEKLMKMIEKLGPCQTLWQSMLRQSFAKLKCNPYANLRSTSTSFREKVYAGKIYTDKLHPSISLCNDESLTSRESLVVLLACKWRKLSNANPQTHVCVYTWETLHLEEQEDETGSSLYVRSPRNVFQRWRWISSTPVYIALGIFAAFRNISCSWEKVQRFSPSLFSPMETSTSKPKGLTFVRDLILYACTYIAYKTWGKY